LQNVSASHVYNLFSLLFRFHGANAQKAHGTRTRTEPGHASFRRKILTRSREDLRQIAPARRAIMRAMTQARAHTVVEGPHGHNHGVTSAMSDTTTRRLPAHHGLVSRQRGAMIHGHVVVAKRAQADASSLCARPQRARLSVPVRCRSVLDLHGSCTCTLDRSASRPRSEPAVCFSTAC
jgi:hypothetical protein